MTCESCSMPMLADTDHGASDPANRYCRYCTDAAGVLRPYDAVLADFTALLVRTHGLNEAAARETSAGIMAAQPAWSAR